VAARGILGAGRISKGSRTGGIRYPGRVVRAAATLDDGGGQPEKGGPTRGLNKPGRASSGCCTVGAPSRNLTNSIAPAGKRDNRPAGPRTARVRDGWQSLEGSASAALLRREHTLQITARHDFRCWSKLPEVRKFGFGLSVSSSVLLRCYSANYGEMLRP
jgi:hypothetical protein